MDSQRVPYTGMRHLWARADARHMAPSTRSARPVTRGLAVGNSFALPRWAGQCAVRRHAPWHRPGRATPNAGRWPRLRSLIALVATIGALVILGHSAVRHSHAYPAHPPHPLLTSLGNEFAVRVGHPHLVDGWSNPFHQVFATPALPRSANDWIALGAAVAAGALMGSLTKRAAPAGRGPPSTHAAALTGRGLLTRLRVARR